MARILFAWELGGGAGHLGPFHTIAQVLKAAGHEITLAVREPSRASTLYDAMGVTIVQAPIKPSSQKTIIRNPATYPQILHNSGFADPNSCDLLLRGWRSVVQNSNPDLIIADHAPGVLFACHGENRRIALLGTGFIIPPDVCPMPRLHADGQFDRETLRNVSEQEFQDENVLLGIINSVRKQFNQSALDTVGQVFSDQCERFLTTFQEFDHYPSRVGGRYYGGLQFDAKQDSPISWPSGVGPKIFAYLKRSRSLGRLLDEIRQSGASTLVVMDGMDVEALRELASPNMRFFNHPLPVDQMARECDLAILNATHGMTCSMLIAGKPILQMPHNLEQFITAARTTELGTAVSASRDDGLSAVAAFHTIRNDNRFAIAAQQFAARYPDFDPQQTAVRIAQSLAQLVA